MFFIKIHLLPYYIFMYSLLVEDSQSEYFASEMCLERTLTIHAVLTQKRCPYEYIEAQKGAHRCPVLCKGNYTTETDQAVNCVEYDINFKINQTLKAKLKDIRCHISDCILKVINFECTFNRNYTEISFNKTTNNEEYLNNQNDTNKEEESPRNLEDEKHQHHKNGREELCFDSTTSVVISLSCLVGGSLFGVGVFVFFKRLKRYKKIRLQHPLVFYRPNYGDGGDLPGEGTATITNQLETEYEDIEERIRMVAKAIQVPSYKEDSSSEIRSRENIYHHLSLTEGSIKKENSDLVSSDSIEHIFGDDVISSYKGSPSFKSVMICTESSSSKSNGNSKVSPTGSVESDKYYALDREYLIFNSSI